MNSSSCIMRVELRPLSPFFPGRSIVPSYLEEPPVSERKRMPKTVDTLLNFGIHVKLKRIGNA